MPEVAVPPPRRRRRWPWIVAALLVLAFLLRGPLLAPLVTRVVAAQLAQAIDGQAQVESADGGWFGDAQLIGITAEAPRGALRQLHIGALQAQYGLGIFAGDLSALQALNLSGVNATIDLRTPGGGWDGVLPPLLELLPTPLPQATLTGEVTLLLPERELRLSDIRLTLAGEQVSLAVRVQVADAEALNVLATFRRPTADTVRLERAVVLGAATIEALELVLGRARQQLIAAVNLGGGQLRVHADPANVRVVAEGLDLSAIPPSLSALWSAVNPAEFGALRGVVAGEASAVYAPQGWNVAGSIGIHDLVVAGAGPFAGSGQWHLGTGVIHLTRLSVDGPAKGQALIEGLVWSLSERRPRAGTLRLDLPDVRGWVPVTLGPPPLLHDHLVALNAEVSVEGDTFAIRSARLAGLGVDLSVQGSVASAPWRIEAADVTARADLATIAGVVPGAPNLAGSVRLRATGTLPITSELPALLHLPSEVQVRSDHLMVGAVAIEHLRLDAHTADGRLHLTQGAATIADLGVAFTGTTAWQDAAWRGALSTLTLDFPGVVASATEPSAFTYGAAGWSVGPVRLASAAGALAIEVRQQGDAGLLVVDAPQLDLGQVGLPYLGGKAQLGIDLHGDWNAPSGQLRLASEDLRIGDRRARLALDLTQEASGIVIRSGRIDAGADGTLLLTGTVPLRLGRTGVTVVPDDGQPSAIEVVVSDLSRWLPQIAAGSANLRLRLGEPQAAHLVDGRLTFSGVRPRPLVEPPAGLNSAQVAELSGGIDLRGTADGVEVAVDLRADGQPTLSGSVRSPGVWDAQTLTGGWRQRALSGQLQLAELPLARLVALLPGVQHLAGVATGGLQLSGTAMEPHWNGSLALAGVQAKFVTEVPTLAEGSAQLDLDGRTIHLRQGGFTLGDAPVTIAGDLTLGQPSQVAVRLDGTNVLLVQRHDARLRADLGLMLSGQLDALVVSGRAVVTSALFSPDLSLWQGGAGRGDGRLVPFEFVTPPWSTLRFDVQVSSAFTSAQDGVRLATNLVRADCDLDLHLRGSGAAPELGGRVVVRKGHVFLPFSTLRLTNGELLFPEGDPFHPRVNAVATAQVRRWRVTLQVDGLLADPQVHASADGLDERDALLLLTAGSTSAELSGEEGQRAALGRLGSWLGLAAWDYIDGESDPDAAPGILDRLTMDFGRKVSDSGKDTIEAQAGLTEPEVNPGVLIYGERDRWDDYNAGLILRFRWGGEE